MSKWFETVQFFYDTNRWNIDRVRNAVTASPPWITAEEFEQITGQAYAAEGG